MLRAGMKIACNPLLYAVFRMAKSPEKIINAGKN